MKRILIILLNFRYLILIAVLTVVAIVDFNNLELARRTFVFYTIGEELLVVEDRMIKKSYSREVNITRYVEEAVLGPVSPGLLHLFSRGTRVNALLYRDGVVFIDLSEGAAIPPIEGGRTLDNFRTLHDNIVNNFYYVNDVRFFIEGNAVFVGEFGVETAQSRLGFSIF